MCTGSGTTVPGFVLLFPCGPGGRGSYRTVPLTRLSYPHHTRHCHYSHPPATYLPYLYYTTAYRQPLLITLGAVLPSLTTPMQRTRLSYRLSIASPLPAAPCHRMAFTKRAYRRLYLPPTAASYPGQRGAAWPLRPPHSAAIPPSTERWLAFGPLC